MKKGKGENGMKNKKGKDKPEGSSGTISVKSCTEVKGWLTYKMAKKYCRKFQPPEGA